jgi:hypothetical protein
LESLESLFECAPSPDLEKERQPAQSFDLEIEKATGQPQRINPKIEEKVGPFFSMLICWSGVCHCIVLNSNTHTPLLPHCGGSPGACPGKLSYLS